MLIKRNFFPDIYRAWRYHSQWRNNWSQSSCYLCWCNCAITKLIPLPSMVYWMSEVPLKNKRRGPGKHTGLYKSCFKTNCNRIDFTLSDYAFTSKTSVCRMDRLRWSIFPKRKFFYHINYGFRFIDRAPERFLLSVSTNSVTENFVHWKLGPLFL